MFDINVHGSFSATVHKEVNFLVRFTAAQASPEKESIPGANSFPLKSWAQFFKANDVVS